jgi:hypothetical protein
MNPESKRPVTVEDLLKLKRAERPPAEFWGRFEAEMRAKQLSAIVARRPWWDGLPVRALARLVRNPVPIGAAAALALTWAGIRYSEPSPVVASRPEPAQARQAPVAAAPSAHAGLSSAPAAAAPQKAPEVASAKVSRIPAPVVVATAPHITRAPVDAPVDTGFKSPFSDGNAVTMADFREMAPNPAQRPVFGSDSDFEPTIGQAHQVAAEPLARVDPAAERRSRLLATALPSGPRAPASDWIRERTASDDRIYESLDRASNEPILTGIRF